MFTPFRNTQIKLSVQTAMKSGWNPSKRCDSFQNVTKPQSGKASASLHNLLLFVFRKLKSIKTPQSALMKFVNSCLTVITSEWKFLRPQYYLTMLSKLQLKIRAHPSRNFISRARMQIMFDAQLPPGVCNFEWLQAFIMSQWWCMTFRDKCRCLSSVNYPAFILPSHSS